MFFPSSALQSKGHMNTYKIIAMQNISHELHSRKGAANKRWCMHVLLLSPVGQNSWKVAFVCKAKLFHDDV